MTPGDLERSLHDSSRKKGRARNAIGKRVIRRNLRVLIELRAGGKHVKSRSFTVYPASEPDRIALDTLHDALYMAAQAWHEIDQHRLARREEEEGQ